MRRRCYRGYDASVDLREAVETRARIDGSLIKVDDFLNHRVDSEVIASVGASIAKRIASLDADVLLTAEASGIPVAVATGIVTGLPVVYAKKYLGPGDRYSYARVVTSPTKGEEYRVEVLRRALDPGSRVVIVDDFLSGGRTAEALGEIAEEAGCEVATFVFAIEKAYMPGRARLEAHGWPVSAVVSVGSVSDGAVTIIDDV